MTRVSCSVNAAALGVFLVALVLYVVTLAPGLLWGGGDFASFQTRLYTGDIETGIFGHPLWVIIARPFLWLPVRDVAYRANLAAACFASLALVFVFLTARRLTQSLRAALLATAALMVSHTFWTYAVMSKPYSLNALLLAACIFFVLRWGQERHSNDLLAFAVLYALSPINHLVMWTGAAGFLAYVVLIARRTWSESGTRRQVALAGIVYLAVSSIYPVLTMLQGQTRATGGAIVKFIAGFAAAVCSPTLLGLGLGAGIALLIYQFPLAIVFGVGGLVHSWRGDRAVATMLTLVALGDVAFLLGATDPRTGGEYVWNLHYYLQVYVVVALWIAIGCEALLRFVRTRWQHVVVSMACVAVPIAGYAVAPIVARSVLANVPGFRQLAGRDNLTYVLSPWKHHERGARAFGEALLNALPRDSILFADYSIWSMVNYLQVVEQARPDVTLVRLPGPGAGRQLPLLLGARGAGAMFLSDVNRYYDMGEIESRFAVTPAGPVYRLSAR